MAEKYLSTTDGKEIWVDERQITSDDSGVWESWAWWGDNPKDKYVSDTPRDAVDELLLHTIANKEAALADAAAENRQLRSNDMTAVMAITNLLNMRAHGVEFEYYARDTLAKIKPLLEGTVPAAAKGGK